MDKWVYWCLVTRDLTDGWGGSNGQPYPGALMEQPSMVLDVIRFIRGTNNKLTSEASKQPNKGGRK